MARENIRVQVLDDVGRWVDDAITVKLGHCALIDPEYDWLPNVQG